MVTRKKEIQENDARRQKHKNKKQKQKTTTTKQITMT